MKKIGGLLFTLGAFLLLSFGCLALKLNYEWQAAFFIMGSLFMMLLANASLVITAIKYELEKKSKQEETKNSGAVEKSSSINVGEN